MVFAHSDRLLSYDFVGCMRDVYVNNIELDLNTAASKFEITNSCPRVSECHQKSCREGSTCIDKWFNTLCQCTNDEYNGPKCDKSKSLDTYSIANKALVKLLQLVFPCIM